MRLRRSRGLTCYWRRGVLIAHPYPHGTPTALPPAAARILDVFEEFTDVAEAVKALAPLEPGEVHEAVRALRAAGLLLAEDTEEAERDEHIARQWGPWAPEAPFFHYGTQHPEGPETGPTGPEEATGHMSGFRAQPPLFTSYPEADRLLLPRGHAELDAPFGRVLYARRTYRDFSGRPVDREVLATLLATVFGPTDFVDCGRSALYRRTSPQGGAQQALDGYVGVLNVTGVDPGVYHYNGREHSLELLSPGLTGEETIRLCAGQEWTGGAAFLVVLAARLDRMRARYRSARCYRVCLLDAGHLGQTFALTATALGLGPAQTADFTDAPLARRLGLDNAAHTPLHVLLAGHPSVHPLHAPPPASLQAFRSTTL